MPILYCTVAMSSCARLPRRSVNAQAVAASMRTESATTARININTASAADLETIPNIGKVLAARIVEHRERYGPFRRVEHLMMVRGLSDHRFNQIRPYVSVE